MGRTDRPRARMCHRRIKIQVACPPASTGQTMQKREPPVAASQRVRAISQIYNILILRNLPRTRAITHSKEQMMPNSNNTKPPLDASNDSKNRGKASAKCKEVRLCAGLREVLRVFGGWDEND